MYASNVLTDNYSTQNQSRSFGAFKDATIHKYYSAQIVFVLLIKSGSKRNSLKRTSTCFSGVSLNAPTVRSNSACICSPTAK